MASLWSAVTERLTIRKTFRAMRKALAYQGRRARPRAPDEVATARYHVALVDPLPARFKALNPILATTGSIPRDKKQTSATEYGSCSCGYGSWWWRPEWFEDQNLWMALKFCRPRNPVINEYAEKKAERWFHST